MQIEGAEEDCASWFNVQKPQVLFVLISRDFFDRSSEKTQGATRPRRSGWVSLFDDDWDVAVKSFADKKLVFIALPMQTLVARRSYKY